MSNGHATGKNQIQPCFPNARHDSANCWVVTRTLFVVFIAPSIKARYFPDGLERRLEFFAPLPQYGSIRVDIEPNQAVEAGAKWRFHGTPGWFDSGHTETAVPVGTYTIAFNEINGWTSPPDVDVSINEDESTEVTEWYERISFQAGDLDHDGDVDGFDLYRFTIAYNSSHPDADLNNDGVVDSTDAGIFTQEYGRIYPSN